jgi:anaerobic magnesium-protoporphyrin IX monomethyl ester cyclase
MLKSTNLRGPVVIIAKEICYTFPFGYAYLAGYLKSKNEPVIIKYRPENLIGTNIFDQFVQDIIKLKPIAVGIGTIYPDLYAAKELIECFNKYHRKFPIVIGGQMVSPTPEFALKITGADYGIIGEGEIAFTKLIKSLRKNLTPKNLKGLVIKLDHQYKSNGPAEYIKDLSNLPAIPYHLFPQARWLNIGQFYTSYADYFYSPLYRYLDRIIPIHGSRGCPYRCNFCYHHNIPRYRPIKEMIAEAKKLILKFNANMIEFNDDLVIATPARARELAKEMNRMNRQLNRKIEYSISSRFNVIDKMSDSLLLELKKSGCRIMGIGLESGSQRILDRIHKHITVEQIITGLKRLKKYNIIPIVAFMVGQLDETKADVNKSTQLLKKLVRQDKNFVSQFTITTPFPGSELYRIALERGIIKNDLDFFNRYNPRVDLCGVSVNLSKMTDQELIKYRNQFETIYLKEKEKLIDPKLRLIEKIRGNLKRKYDLFQIVIKNILPQYSQKIINFTDIFHNYIQIKLDKQRLNLLDIHQ